MERVGVVVVALVCVTGLALADHVDDGLRSLCDGRPALATVLGWLPVGGLATWVAALLAGRALRTARGRPGSTGLDRLLVGVALVWLGATLSLLPVSKGVGRERDLASIDAHRWSSSCGGPRRRWPRRCWWRWSCCWSPERSRASSRSGRGARIGG